MHEELRRMFSEWLNREGPLLLHDSAWPHVAHDVAHPVQQKLIERYETLLYPSYSQDLSPTEYHTLKHLGVFLSGKSSNNEAQLEAAIDQFISARTPDLYATQISTLSH
ncbi:hypothetical protein ANCCAN_01212 [Ancylostoma caninum]|uniref:Tc1-like transposase DDE domain-containing protein n=1 Tax=Ancylostoma caninum TaxID=29170 RepID=A0A368H7G9_ANCCA|nr:hypothetical protein ANCCAN_01212 [Ancylostoma caninum]